jgi:amino acid adenylation domain-containing protein
MLDQDTWREQLARLPPDKRAALLQRLRPGGGIAGGGAAASGDEQIPRAPRRGPLPLSFAQERLWFLDQLTPGLAAYNIALAVRLRGRLDRPALARALAAVVRRHEVLRTRFRDDGGRPRQEVVPAALLPPRLPLIDLRAGSAETSGSRREQAARRLAGDEAARPFDLAQGPPLRARLVWLEDDEHLLLLTLHHIAADVWSLGVLLHEMAALYTGAALPELPVQYADYALWQRQHLQGERLQRQLDFWRGQLAGLPALDLEADHRRVPAGVAGALAPRGGRVTLVVPAPLADALRLLGREAAATPFMTLLAGYAVVLARTSGQDDFAVGTAVANRGRRELEGLIGFFVNVLALRLGFGGEPSFRQLLARVRALALAAFGHQELPFEKLVEELRPARDSRHLPLVQATFQLQNAPLPSPRLPGLDLVAVPLDGGQVKFELSLSLAEAAGQGGAIAGALDYSADLFTAATAARLAGHFRQLLAAAVAAPDVPVSRLSLLDEAERRQLLGEWSGSAAWWGEVRPAHRLFEACVERTPAAPALICGDLRLTYDGLNRRANRLAHRLRHLGVGPETRVGLCLERGTGFAVSVLAVLKAGGAWVPLDPTYPAERLALMVGDAAPRVVVTLERHRGLAAGAPVLILDGEAGAEPALPEENPPGVALPDNAAYVIYTSGSTGRPKGVVVPHRGLYNLILSEAERRGLGRPRRVLQFSSPSFDASVTEFFQAIAWGGTLVYGTRDQLRSPQELAALARRHEVDTATLPPAMVALLDPRELPGLAVLIVAGEPCAPEVVARFRVGRRFWNAYGPTECTVCATTYECRAGASTAEPDAAAAPPPPIGRPLANLRTLVLDAEMEPAPVGLAGELFLGGESLARGYLGQPALTAERFVPDPFGPAGGRLYRTGDRARWRADGELEFQGRTDQQLKLRGFRIEPGEIEAVLRREAGVREAVVLAREHAPGDRRLVAYVEEAAAPGEPAEAPAPARGAEATAATAATEAPAATAADGAASEPQVPALLRRSRGRELRDRLARQLPDYMVPAAVVVLDRLPRLPNGKLDRRSLPAPDAGGGEPEAGFVAPRGPLEELLAGIWSEVLGVERVGVEDDFFTELGGHSLLATQVMSRLRERLRIDLPLRSLFDAPTVSGLAALAGEAAGRDGRNGGDAVPALRRRELPAGAPVPLSFAQERLWFLDQLAPGLAVYNVPLAVRLTGRLDRRALARALRGVVRRHETLRTRFGEADGRPVHWIAAPDAAAAPLPLVDLRALRTSAAAAAKPAGAVVPQPAAVEAASPAASAARQLAGAEAARPFDLRQGPLLRARLVRLDVEEHLLLLTLHHIVSDGWSLGVLVREVARLYAGEALPEPAVQYADYALWLRQWLQDEALQEQLGYWRAQLAGLPALELPADRRRPAVPSHRGARLPLALPPPLARALRQLSRGAGVTLFMTLLAGFQVVLARIAGQDDVAVGTAVANRRRRELEELIGFFVNTLVLRTDLGGGASFRELLVRVREVALAAYGHQDLPFERLVEELRPERDAARPPLAQVFFVLQNAPLPDVHLPGLQLEALPVDSGTAKFDLSLVLSEDGEGIAGMMELSLDLFEPATVARWGGHLLRLLAAAAADPDRRIAELPLLDAAERRQVIEEWNRTAADWGPPRPVHELFEAQVERTPAAAAVVSGDLVLTYAGLNRRANRLAHQLRALGVGPEARVGLCLERGPELIAAVLAVLKAGGAYVPLDPDYPAERLALMIEDAAPRVVLAAERHRALAAPAPVLVPGPAGGGPPCDTPGATHPGNAARPGSAAWPDGNLAPAATPANAAYVIFTSGSTGRPKGAVVEHRHLSHLIQAIAHAWDLRRPRRVLQFSSPSFDASVGEFFAALPWGGALVDGGPGRFLPAHELVALLREQAVDVAILPPSVLALVEPAGCGGLATLVAAGEACSAEVAARWSAGRRMWNGYGPTECTVFATTADCASDCASAGAAAPPPPPIGRPIANVRAHVLDPAMGPCPVGVPGELYVGGAGVSRGYLNRPGLTAERFVPDPFGAPGERLYRTGDRTFWRQDGALEYRGRLDHQIKLRGFRIELGEIEAVLRRCPEVREAVVLLREDAPGDPRLVAYVVPAEAGGGAAPAPVAGDVPQWPSLAGELRRHCQRHLPDYMVPAAFVALAHLPLTANGKIDRRALPAPAAPGAARARGHAAPESPLQEILAGIWEEVLGVERVGVEDDFFVDLGGHSLLATQVVARVRERLRLDLPLRSLFEAPTVRGWAAAAEAAALEGGQPQSGPRRRSSGGELPLSFAQERLWFLEQLTPGLAVYNVPLAVSLRGRLDTAALAAALAALVRRHEILRTRFVAAGGRPVQVIARAAETAAVPLPLVDLGGLREAEAVRLANAEATRAFDLSQGPPLRATLLRLRRDEHLLLLTLHHIASDGWSLGVLTGDLGRLYAGEALPELPVQYADYAVWQRQWLRGNALEIQLAYWRRQLAGLPALQLPADRPRPAVRSHRGGWARVELPAALAACLRQLGRSAAVTPFMVLLAGYQTLLARTSGQLDLAVATAVANRRHRELEGLIGFFVNTLVLRGDLGGEPTFREVLARVREVSLSAYGHQDVPFEKLVEELRPARDTGQNPLAQVMLVLQNVPLPPLRLPALARGAREQSALELSVVPLEGRTAKLDLSLLLADDPSGGLGIGGVLEYDAELFDAATAWRLAGHFRRLLAAAVAMPDRRAGELPLLDETERRQVLEEWNRTASEPRPPRSLHALVAEVARRSPGAVAVTCRGRRVSYGELWDAAERLAARLRRRGIGAEQLVAVCMERSPEMVVALLGVLASGAAYLPLDPDHPAARRALVLADARTACGVTTSRTLARLEASGGTNWLCLDAMESPETPEIAAPEAVAAAPAGALVPPPGEAGVLAGDGATGDPSALAYVIYTSGSTGTPKGVAITHGNAVAFLDWCAAAFPRQAFDGLLASTSINFDLSVFEIFATLSRGGTMVLAENLFDESAWTGDWPITLVNTVPSLLAQLLPSRRLPPEVGIVNLAGEALGATLVQRVREQAPATAVVNLYGPTEATTYATWALVAGTAGADLGAGAPATDAATAEAPPPIGRPVAGTRVYVLDAAALPLPEGVPGELYIGGEGVARGYLRRPELTAERFVPDGFGPPGERLYRTGDRVRWRAGGVLEYLGRLDHQVKLRGFRIEPGEIEAALRASPLVREAVVVLREDAPSDQGEQGEQGGQGERGGRRLVAYVAPAPAGATGQVGDAVAALRDLCRERLPAHMVPAAFVVLERLPLTPNGKVDRRALPAPDAAASGSAAGFVAPATPLEEIVAGLWAEVLGRERVGAQDDFFTDLGGHSLLATQVVARARERLGVELPLRSLFEAPTVAAWAARMEQAAAPAAPPLVRRGGPAEEPAAELPLSFAQERLWFLEQLSPGLAVYNLPLAVRLRGRLDRPALARSLAAAVRRHEALRTRFHFDAGRPVQIVVTPAEVEVPLPLVDLRAPGSSRGGKAPPRPAAESVAREVARLGEGEAARTFDLARGPLLRGCLLWLDREEHLLLLTLHHIASDGWSLGVLIGELGRLYAGEALPELPVQYPDYALWQRGWLRGEVLASQLTWWRDQLAGLPVLQLPADRPRPAVLSHRGAQLRAELPAPALAALRQLGREVGVTLFMTLLAGFHALLARISGQEDFAVGTAVANRGRRELEGLIGFFVNTLALRASVAGEPSFHRLVARVRQVTLGAYAHQEVPFEKLVEELRPARDTGQNPLVQVMLVLQNAPVPRLSLPGLELVGVPVASRTAKFDLLVSLSEHPDGITGTWEYDADLFDPATVARLAGHFEHLLAGAVAAPRREVAELPLLDRSQRHQVLTEWSGTAAGLGEPRPVHRLFEAQVARAPEAVAVVAGGLALSYAELNRRANRLAHHLRALGVGPEVRVGLALQRGADQIAVILAVLKAGGAYVPLDLSYPPARLAWMIEDAAPRVVLTTAAHRALAAPAPAYCLDGDGAALALLPVDDPAPAAGLDNAAYVIFTSGSTGRPKGVVMPHRPLADLFAWQLRDTPAACRVLQLAPSSFDVSCQEIFTTLGAGGTLVLIDESLRRDPYALGRLLAAERIERLFLPFTALQQLAQALPAAAGGALREIITAGERLQITPEIGALCRSLPGSVLFNQYGPTETHVVTSHRLAGSPESWETWPAIGRPVAGAGIHVLDRRLQPVPAGVPGELCVGGAAVARGYQQRPEATAERFVPDPFGAPGGRLYRTGDRARWRRDGDLEYLGRLDQQVKLRGFRIEPGEVEGVLARSGAVQEAAVVVREDTAGDPRLVAYLVPVAARAAAAAAGGIAGHETAELRRHCQRFLPGHMVPSSFVWLDRLPWTPSGKIDRRALAALPAAAAGPALAAGHVEPQSEMERTLAAAWREVLQVGRVGIADNFFDLGGHSLLMLRLHRKLQDLLGRELAVVDLFRFPTVESFARFLTRPAAAMSRPGAVPGAHAGAGAGDDAGSAAAARAADGAARAADGAAKAERLSTGRGRLQQQLAARQRAAGRRRPS